MLENFGISHLPFTIAYTFVRKHCVWVRKGNAFSNNLEVPVIRFDDFIVRYEDDKFFRPVLKYQRRE